MSGSVGRAPAWHSLLIGGLDVGSKPRSRSEWEQRFSFWQRPASDTEEAKIETASRRIKRALENDQAVRQLDWTIIPQGSYRNNTNVRLESDVDFCVRLNSAFFFEGPPNFTLQHAGLYPLAFSFGDFKQAIASALIAEYGNMAVDVGEKAIHLNKDDMGRVSADVVPAFTFHRYSTANTVLGPPRIECSGIAFELPISRRIINFPEQHYANGCAKNDRTHRRFKRVVRILKRLRNHMLDNTGVPPPVRDAASRARSFLIESLVFNCPDAVFNSDSIYENVCEVLHYLNDVFNPPFRRSLLAIPESQYWTEVNGIKKLFELNQAWSQNDAASFVVGALAYMEA
ncbi:MAG: nucleotidyltransferase [Rhodospirillaceae bacterium]|nr:MAG: nucleotidyltransferase [Rhodospirillaceae bacterium]